MFKINISYETYEKKNGLQVVYHPNGNIKYRTFLKNGLIDGVFEIYRENGRLKFKTFFKNGTPYSLVQQFFENDLQVK